MKTFWVFIALCGCALLPSGLFAVFGYGGHDFPFHFSSWLEIHSAWQSGILNSGWADGANLGFGDPHLSFYPPLSPFLGAVLCTILPLRIAPGAFVSLTLWLSGVSMYIAARSYVAPRDRFMAALLYMYSPYLLMTAFNRFAAGEMLAMAGLPLTLHCFIQVMAVGRRRSICLLAGLLGLTLLANIPASVVLLYCLLAVALLATVQQRSLAPLAAFGMSCCLALALAAFYLAPALYEQRWIQPGTLLRFDYWHSFITSSMRGTGIKGFQISARLFACLESALVVSAFAQLRRKKASTAAQYRLLQLVVIALLFQLPLSSFLWRTLPDLRLVQFSYRFLSITAAALPLVLLSSHVSPFLRRATFAAMALMACLPLAGYPLKSFEFQHRPYEPAATVVSSNSGGYVSPVEYLPAGATAPGGRASSFIVSTHTSGTSASCQAVALASSPEVRTFTLQANAPCIVQLALYNYPYWRISDEANTYLPTQTSPGGLLAVVVPPGQHTLRATFHAASRLRTVSAVLSLVTALALSWCLCIMRPANQVA